MDNNMSYLKQFSVIPGVLLALLHNNFLVHRVGMSAEICDRKWWSITGNNISPETIFSYSWRFICMSSQMYNLASLWQSFIISVYFLCFYPLISKKMVY